jgi:hypothetical protein
MGTDAIHMLAVNGDTNEVAMEQLCLLKYVCTFVSKTGHCATYVTSTKGINSNK